MAFLENILDFRQEGADLPLGSPDMIMDCANPANLQSLDFFISFP
jgi:hypothetical protein